MTHLPDRAIDSVARRERPEEQPLEPEYGLKMIESLCPDPDCAHPLWAADVSEDHRVVPSHYSDSVHCWLSKIPWSEARHLVALREENGGWLKRAAHP